MRLKVKILFMMAAGLLFVCGPMLGSAFAKTYYLDVSPGTASGCNVENGGKPSFHRDGTLNSKPKYDIVYNFTVPVGSSTCGATIPFKFSGGSTNADIGVEARNSGAATWSHNSFKLDSNNRSEKDPLTLQASGLTSGEDTYTPGISISYFICNRCGSTKPTIYEKLSGPGAGSYDGDYFSGKVLIHVYVDGLDRLHIDSEGSLGSSGTPLSCNDNGTSVIGGGNTPALAVDGSNLNQYVYTYKIKAGQTVCDAVPIDLNVSNTDQSGDASGAGPAYPLEVTCNSTLSSTVNNNNFCGDSYAYIDTPAPTVSDGGFNDVTAYFDSGPMNVAGTYDLYFQVVDPNAKTDDLAIPYRACVPNTGCLSTDPSDGLIHIQIKVSSVTQAFFTDGNFAGLLNCAGEPVKLSDGGTFDIVPGGKGKSTIESTNPGEFFYNLIWTNTTTSEQTINFTVPTSYNVTSKGAESVHVYAFDPKDPGGFDESVSSFDKVLGSGSPCTDPTSNTCTIQGVPAGDIVWIVWHVTYSQIGNSTTGLPTFADVCPDLTKPPTGASDATNNIYANGQITYAGLGTPITSSASAWGYLKH